jgi:hypothetical protein
VCRRAPIRWASRLPLPASLRLVRGLPGPRGDIPRMVYHDGKARRFVIELEPEVRDWLETLTLRDYVKVEAMADPR